jgi:glycogen synthase
VLFRRAAWQCSRRAASVPCTGAHMHCSHHITAERACREDEEAWKALVKRGMERDCSWDRSAEQYEQVMTWAKTDLPYCG